MPPKKITTTRKKCDIFLVGQHDASITDYGKLPLANGVMKYTMYRRTLAEF